MTSIGAGRRAGAGGIKSAPAVDAASTGVSRLQPLVADDDREDSPASFL